MYILAQTIDQLNQIAKSNDYTLVGVLLMGICVIVAGLALAAWKFSAWASVRVDSAIARAYKHLDGVDETMTCLRDSIGGIVPRLQRIEEKVDGVSARVDNLDNHIFKDK